MRLPSLPARLGLILALARLFRTARVQWALLVFVIVFGGLSMFVSVAFERKAAEIAVAGGVHMPELANALAAAGGRVREARPGERTDPISGPLVITVAPDTSAPARVVVSIPLAMWRLGGDPITFDRFIHGVAQSLKDYRSRALSERGFDPDIPTPFKSELAITRSPFSRSVDPDPQSDFVFQVVRYLGSIRGATFPVIVGACVGQAIGVAGFLVLMGRRRLEGLAASRATGWDIVAALALRAGLVGGLYAALAYAFVIGLHRLAGAAVPISYALCVPLAGAYAATLACLGLAGSAQRWHPVPAFLAGSLATILPLGSLHFARAAEVWGFGEGWIRGLPFVGFASGLVTDGTSLHETLASGATTLALALLGAWLAAGAIDARTYAAKEI